MEIKEYIESLDEGCEVVSVFKCTKSTREYKSFIAGCYYPIIAVMDRRTSDFIYRMIDNDFDVKDPYTGDYNLEKIKQRMYNNRNYTFIEVDHAQFLPETKYFVELI